MAGIDNSPKPSPVAFIRDAEDIDILLAMFPGPVSIAPNRFAWSDRTRLLGRLVGGFIIVVLSVPFMILVVNAVSIGSWGWIAFASAGICFCLFALLAISLAQPGSLVLDKEGFTVRSGFAYQTCRWADVRDFRLGGIIRFPRIRFKNISPSARRRVLLGLGEDWLKFLIPYRDKALATVMNQWRERALATTVTNYPSRGLDRP